MTTAAFDYTALTPTDETLREYVFDYIPGSPSVWVAPATDENKAYLSERLRMQIEDAEAEGKSARQKTQKLEVDDLIRKTEKSISDDKKLLARCCGKKWGKAPTATDGTKPEFSEANFLAFLTALPDYMFHPFNRYCGNIFNFVERPALDSENLGNE